MNNAVVFGGSGFIGSHFIMQLLKSGAYDHIYIADYSSVRDDFKFPAEKVTYCCVDVRKPIEHELLPAEASLICNFAAIHREPGHEVKEYYETNIYGAENVTDWARKIGCSKLIFTSSIAPYGVSEDVKDEETLPVPLSAYGGSKLVAEKIHMVWQAENPSRSLVIVRPGVVFGPGENGNVTRMVKAVLHGYFLYLGNRDTRKSGGYVKELTETMTWALGKLESQSGGVYLYNFSLPDIPSIYDYVKTVRKISSTQKFVMTMPYWIVYSIASVLDIFAGIFRIPNKFSPVRVRKLVRSNHILPNRLIRDGYVFRYDIDSAFNDWRSDRLADWS